MIRLTLRQIAIGCLVLAVVEVALAAIVKDPWPSELISTYALITMAMVAYVGHRVVQEQNQRR